MFELQFRIHRTLMYQNLFRNFFIQRSPFWFLCAPPNHVRNGFGSVWKRHSSLGFLYRVFWSFCPSFGYSERFVTKFYPLSWNTVSIEHRYGLSRSRFHFKQVNSTASIGVNTEPTFNELSSRPNHLVSNYYGTRGSNYMRSKASLHCARLYEAVSSPP